MSIASNATRPITPPAPRRAAMTRGPAMGTLSTTTTTTTTTIQVRVFVRG